jgi:hypothetical protein
MIRTIAIAACAILAAVSAGLSANAQNGYTAEQGAAFSAQCESDGNTPAHCTCLWNRIQSGMSVQDYVALANAYGAQTVHPLMGRFELMIGECNGTSRVTASNPEAYPGHTSTNFMNGCLGGGVAQAVCACSMNTLEREIT